MKRFIFLIAVLIMALCACAPLNDAKSAATSGQNSDGTFSIRIYADKEVYSAGEAILCWAVVEYVGEGAAVIYSSDPLVGFGLKDGKYFDGGYAVDDVLITTEFKKGEPVTYQFSKSGGWSGEDPDTDFYKQFYSEKELRLPVGEYEISATIKGFFDKDDYQGSEYEVKASVKIRVE